jgi:hypothetical protein
VYFISIYGYPLVSQVQIFVIFVLPCLYLALAGRYGLPYGHPDGCLFHSQKGVKMSNILLSDAQNPLKSRFEN